MTEPPNASRDSQTSAFWSLARKVAVALTVLAVAAGIFLHQNRSGYYDRTRTDLLEASRQLEIYHHDMELLVQEYRHAAQALRTSVGWLRQAAALDPNDLGEIDAIAEELERWEELARDGALTPGELHQRYASLAERVQQLIDKRTQAAAGN